MKTFLIVLSVLLFVGSIGSGQPLSILIVGGFSVFLFIKAVRMKPSAKGSRQPKARAEKKPREPKQPREPKPPRVTSSRPVEVAPAGVAENAARRLREFATAFEDPAIDAFFSMGDIDVIRSTQSQNTAGPGGFVFSRSGLTVVYANRNARQPAPKQMQKGWNQIIGVTPNTFNIYFKDRSSFEFKPRTSEDHLVLSAFWQTFNLALNGFHQLIQQPKQSDLGARLRNVADYIDTHRTECASGAIDVDKILGIDVPELAPQAQAVATKLPHAGDILGGWKLKKALGEGAFGAVYLAEEVGNSEETAAIKVLKPAPGVSINSPQFHIQANQFIEEAKRSFNFADEAYVLNAHDYGTEPWPWIRYPFLNGGTVESLANSGEMTWNQWWNLAHDLLSGLDSIHAEGMVHKDIKQDNVMRLEDRFVILDLGISLVEGYEQLAQGAFFPPIMAPEIWSDVSSRKNPAGSFTPKSDVFAAGITLYWCVRHTNPWPLNANSGSAEHRLHQIQSEEIDFRGFPDDAVELLKQMLILDVNKRPNARTLLFDVLPHIDIELKTAQVEHAIRDIAERLVGEDSPEIEGDFTNTVKGPFATWETFTMELRRVVEEIRPSYFALNLEFLDGREPLYVQAMSGGGGWILECMSEKFSEKQLTLQQKAQFLSLGWDAPTTSSPNFERNEGDISVSDMTNIFIAALELGYGIRPAELSSLHTQARNSGAY